MTLNLQTTNGARKKVGFVFYEVAILAIFLTR
jgi:hypothetical protein